MPQESRDRRLAASVERLLERLSRITDNGTVKFAERASAIGSMVALGVLITMVTLLFGHVGEVARAVNERVDKFETNIQGQLVVIIDVHKEFREGITTLRTRQESQVLPGLQALQPQRQRFDALQADELERRLLQEIWEHDHDQPGIDD